jgi:UDP-3-O-[3-hydroxymyristoyl] N-acetylglucosamine deacetylase
MDRQRTIGQAIGCSGAGLHSGAPVAMRVFPADPGQGVRFVRTDVSDRDPVVIAHALNVTTTRLGTNIANADGVFVATVEHLLAACSGLGLDNLTVEIATPEVPIFEGSSATYCRLFREAGIVAQDAPRRRLKVAKTVIVSDGPKWARLDPGEGRRFEVAIDFSSRAIGRQVMAFDLASGAFEAEIAQARTFGFMRDVDALRAAGLARGGALDNAIVIDGDRIVNPEALSRPDDFVRHKILDVIGDMFLAGAPIEGAYCAEQPGHQLNNTLLRALFSDPANYTLI